MQVKSVLKKVAKLSVEPLAQDPAAYSGCIHISSFSEHFPCLSNFAQQISQGSEVLDTEMLKNVWAVEEIIFHEEALD